MWAEDNDCYYGSVEPAVREMHSVSMSWRDFKKDLLNIQLLGAESTSSDEKSCWNLRRSPSLPPPLPEPCKKCALIRRVTICAHFTWLKALGTALVQNIIMVVLGVNSK